MATAHRLHAGSLQSLARRILMAAGTPPHIAADVAEVLVNANLTGHDSHGVLRIASYLQAIEDGRLIPSAEPVILKETATVLVVDGRHGFGHHTARWAMGRAIEKARGAGVCCASLVRTGHIGRLGEYAEQAARAGCIGLITSGDVTPGDAEVVPFAGIRGILGTNPVAAGVPTGDDAPFVLDYATSAVAAGKIRIAHGLGADLPQGVLIDKHGAPTVRTADFYDGGFLLPFGQHKGYALGVLVALLGGLTGTFDVERGSVEGKFMQAINIAAFTPLEAFQRGVRAALTRIREVPPAPGVGEVLVPGDPEARARTRRLADGIDLPDAVFRDICRRAQALDVPLNDEEARDG